jgi:hypothetical protein
MVLSEYDDIVSHKYVRATEQTDNFGLIEVEKKNFPTGWFEEHKRSDESV